MGTPLSDPTEERIWRMYVHRAIYVRNRDPRAPTNTCRLGCLHEESMLHLVHCPVIAIFWTACMEFTHKVLGGEPIHMLNKTKIERAIIFGMADHRTLLAQPSRAFLRHAWGVMYRHFTQAETEEKTFNPRVRE